MFQEPLAAASFKEKKRKEKKRKEKKRKEKKRKEKKRKEKKRKEKKRKEARFFFMNRREKQLFFFTFFGP